MEDFWVLFEFVFIEFEMEVFGFIVFQKINKSYYFENVYRSLYCAITIKIRAYVIYLQARIKIMIS